MKDKRLNVRDLVNIGLFSILIFITTFIGGMIGFVPNLIPATTFVAGLVSGPVYMLYSTKIKKVGMVFITTIILCLVFMATGHGIWILLTGIVGGVLGELILKKGQYKSAKSARMAFTIQSIYTVGNWLPVYFARDPYIKQMIDMGYGEEFTQKMMRVLPDWSLIPLVLFGMLGTFIGCTVGIKILKKHFAKEGVAK